MSNALLDYAQRSKQDRIGKSTINPLASSTNDSFKVNTSLTLINGNQDVIALNYSINHNFIESIRKNTRVGTGGYILASMMVSTRTTGGVLYSLETPLQKANPNKTEVVRSIKSILSTIRSSLSLNMKEMGEILKVERQTVYSWIGGDSAPHPSNRNRLNEIFSVARYWETLSSVPLGTAVRQSCRNGKSIVNLLCENTLDKKEISTHLELLAENQIQDIASQKTQNKPGVRELAARHKLKIRESSDTIDWLTGKRIDAE